MSEEKSGCLNVELVIRSESGLDDLVEAFRAVAFQVSNEDGVLSLELNEERKLEDAVQEFVRIVNSFNPEVKKIWDECASRCFNIGLLSDDHDLSETHWLSEEVVKAIAGVRCSIAVTAYT